MNTGIIRISGITLHILSMILKRLATARPDANQKTRFCEKILLIIKVDYGSDSRFPGFAPALRSTLRYPTAAFPFLPADSLPDRPAASMKLASFVAKRPDILMKIARRCRS
jgi:hypothetical protein